MVLKDILELVMEEINGTKRHSKLLMEEFQFTKRHPKLLMDKINDGKT